MEKNNKLLIWIVVIELALLVFLGYEAISHGNNQMLLSPEITAWESRYVPYSENGWMVNSEETSSFSEGEEVDLIYGPFITLPRGSYSVSVDYETEDVQGLEVYSSTYNKSIIRHEEELLKADANTVTFHFTCLRNLDDVEVRVRYNGQGSLAIKNIQIVQSSFVYREIFVFVFLIFAIADICLIVASRCAEDIKNDTRELWIDVCRGIGMIFVLIGHSEPPFKWLIFGFHLPLFFMISGYLYKDKDENETGPYVAKLFRRYIVPYFVLCAINLVIQSIRVAIEDTLTWSMFRRYLVDIFYSGEWLPNCLPLWFLTALFISMILLHLIHRFENPFYRLVLVFGCLVIAAYAIKDGAIRVPWNIYSALIGVFFAEAGYCIKRYGIIKKIKNVKWYDAIGVLSMLLVCGGQAVWMNHSISGEIVSIHEPRMMSVPLMVIGAILLSAFVMIGTSLICDKISDCVLAPLVSLGRHTIIYFGFEFCVNSIIEKVTPHLLNSYSSWYLNFMCKFVVLAVLSLAWNRLKDNRM